MPELQLWPVTLTWSTEGQTLVYAETAAEAEELAKDENRDDYETTFSDSPDVYVGAPITAERVRKQDPDLASQQVILPDGDNCSLAEVEAKIEAAAEALRELQRTPGTPEYRALIEQPDANGMAQMPLAIIDAAVTKAMEVAGPEQVPLWSCDLSAASDHSLCDVCSECGVHNDHNIHCSRAKRLGHLTEPE